MERASFDRVAELWPDVAQPFSRIVPDGCRLVRAVEDWRPGLRMRTLELARGQNCPALDELIEEAAEDAERRGWTPLEDESGRWELESVVLRIETGVFAGEPVLRVAFEQPWPLDAGAPVETSEAFQKMVREVLELRGEPLRLAKTVIVDPDRTARIDSLREAVELPLDPGLITRFPRIGFTFDAESEAWRMGMSFGDYEMTALVRETFERARVEVIKARPKN